MFVYRNVIVSAEHVDLARRVSASIDPAHSSGLFKTGLCPVGTGDATHYISTGFGSERFAALLPLATWEFTESDGWAMTDYYPGDPAAVVQACLELDPPLEVTYEEIEAMYDAGDVTTQEPFAAMLRLGLRLWQPEET